MKQSPLFRTGDLYLPLRIVSFLDQYIIGSNQSAIYLNYWSILHFLSGVFTYYYLTQSGIYALIIHTLWELWQIVIGMTKYWTNRGQIDILIDTIVFFAGFTLMSRLDKMDLNNKT